MPMLNNTIKLLHLTVSKNRIQVSKFKIEFKTERNLAESYLVNKKGLQKILIKFMIKLLNLWHY